MMNKLIPLTAALLCCVLLCACSLGSIRPETKKDEKGAESRTVEIPGEVRSMDIGWSSGSVTLICADCSRVTLTETAPHGLTEENSMSWQLEGTTLKVRFIRGTQLLGNAHKDLTITVPADFRAECFLLSTASADFSCEKLPAETLEITSSSGSSLIGSTDAKDIRMGSASGDITLSASGVQERLKLSSSSGKLLAEAGTVSVCEIDSSSGDIALSAEAVGTLTIDSSSGKIDAEIRGHAESAALGTSSGDIRFLADGVGTLELESSSGRCSAGISGSAEKIGIRTSSGDITLRVPETLGLTLETDCRPAQFEHGLPLRSSGSLYTAGDGSAELRLRSSSGRVRLDAFEP